MTSRLMEIIGEIKPKLEHDWSAMDLFNDFSIRYYNKPYAKSFYQRVRLFERYVRRYIK